MSRSHFMMAARQYLTVAMRLMGEKSRENTFLALLKLDGDSRTSYPLRSVQNLSPYPAGGPNAAEANKAAALAKIACFGPAARTFAKIAEQEPNNAELWRNVALCRAWDADEPAAAVAFHKAAAVSQNFELCGRMRDLRSVVRFEARVRSDHADRNRHPDSIGVAAAGTLGRKRAFLPAAGGTAAAPRGAANRRRGGSCSTVLLPRNLSPEQLRLTIFRRLPPR